MKKYGWIITWANDEFLDSKEIGITGPRGLTATKEEMLEHGTPFRMLDDDGILYYEGKVLNYHEFGPLDDFGRGNAGCTDIQYQDKDGEWKTL